MKTHPTTARPHAGNSAAFSKEGVFYILPPRSSPPWRGGIRRYWLLPSLLSVLTLPATAAVPVSYGSSSGYGLSAKLTVANLPVVDTPDAGKSSGTARPAYSPPPAGINLNASSPVLGLFTATGALSSSVASTVDGLPGTRTTSATGKVTGLNLSLADPPLLPALLTLGGNGSVIGSECQVQGDGDASQATGAATLTNVSLSVLGVPVNLPANPSPNTIVAVAGGVAGLTIYLNEQTPVSGSNGREIACTALRIHLDSVTVLGIGVISGDIKAGVSTAKQYPDRDGDGVLDPADGDADGDGIPNVVEMARAAAGGDTDGDGVPDYLDLDSDNDGLNDVIEAGGVDADGDARQDGSGDADHDGLVDTVDPDRGGTVLPLPDSDGDGAVDYLDLDSDNDTVSDLLEGGSGGSDANHDGMVDGGDTDGDGIRDEVDQLPVFGDAGDSGAVNTDHTDAPDYIDPDSDDTGGTDIDGAGHKDLDSNGDGRIDGPVVDPDHDGVDARVDTLPAVFGGTGGCLISGAAWKRRYFTAAEIADPAVTGWEADPDHDGLTNAMEFVFGTDPLTASPQPDIVTGFNEVTGMTITVDRDSCVRGFMAVEYSTDLVGWTATGPGISYIENSPSALIAAVTGNFPGGGSESPPGERLFIRLRITVP